MVVGLEHFHSGRFYIRVQPCLPCATPQVSPPSQAAMFDLGRAETWKGENLIIPGMEWILRGRISVWLLDLFNLD